MNQSTGQLPAALNRPPPKTRRGFMAVLAAIATVFGGTHSKEYRSALNRGFRHGKHNGQNPGAFGGPSRAKAHRQLYVA